jgi:hypothetical protein
MTRQIALGYGLPSPADLEHRIHLLEARVAALTEAVTLLTQAYAEDPPAGPGGEGVATAARHAYELLAAGHQPENAKSADEPPQPGR